MLKIIQSRMEKHVEREMPDEQAGFTKHTGTRDQMTNVRLIMQRERAYNEDVYMAFTVSKNSGESQSVTAETTIDATVSCLLGSAGCVV